MIIQHVALLGVVDFGVWDALRDILLLLLVALLLGTIAERLRQSVEISGERGDVGAQARNMAKIALVLAYRNDLTGAVKVDTLTPNL